jgi:hypothetical protein
MVQPYNYMLNVPDPTQSVMGGIQQGLQLATAVDKFKLQQQQRQEQAALQTELGKLAENPTTANLAQMMVKYPSLSEQFKRTYDVLSTEQQQERLSQGSRVYSALKANRPDLALSFLEEQATAYDNSNRPQDAKTLRDLSTLIQSSPETAITSTGLFLAHGMGPDKFAESFTKLEQEQRTAELFPTLQAQKQAELNKARSDAEVAAVEAKYADQLQQAQLAKAKREVEAQSGERVQSSSIRPDGTVVIVTSAGRTRVIGPDGVELTGQARVDAVRGAEEFGADIQALRSGARKAGEIGQTEAQKAFENVGKIRKNISNLDSAIAALDAGANTGVIASKFPNWKASTIELQNIQRQLGLDIIGSVTFGALSEGELSLALETALPLNMNEAELKDWLIRKKTAQTKLADYITDQARFLSVPGRTLGDWLQRAEQRGGVEAGGMTAPGTAGAPTTTAAPAAPAAAAPASAAGAPVRVTSPSGQVFTFPNQQAADAFKRAAGIQ